MDKERNTKAIKEIIDKTYGESPTAVLRNRLTSEYRVICNEEVAKAIVEAGYGDTKQAAREFAEKFEKHIEYEIERETNHSKIKAYNKSLNLIKGLLAEVTGE